MPMWAMVQRDQPEDFLVATGESHRLEDFVAAAFGYYNLDWRQHVDTSPALYRPDDICTARVIPRRPLLPWAGKPGTG